MDCEKEDAVAGPKMRRAPRLKPVLLQRLFEGLKAHASTRTPVLTAGSAVSYVETEDPPLTVTLCFPRSTKQTRLTGLLCKFSLVLVPVLFSGCKPLKLLSHRASVD